MDDVFLRRRIDRLVDLGEHRDRLGLLSLFEKICDLAHHRLELCLVRLQAPAANGVLTSALDGGLDDGHARK